MGRPAGQSQPSAIDSHVVVPQRRVGCGKCGTLYIGHKLEVTCPSCKARLKTVDVKATMRVPTGTWVYKDAKISNSSIIGEVIADGSATE